MGATTGIEWTDSTWNPLRARNRETGKIGWFCVHASEGCRNCYAETMNRRLGAGVDYKAQNRGKAELFLDEKMLTAPLRWKRPRMIFVCSMTDLFADFVPDALIDRLFAVMALCPQHTFQVLTKRPERMRTYMENPDHAVRWFSVVDDVFARAHEWAYGPVRPNTLASNVWLGVSCEDQAAAAARIPHLIATPAAIRFLSCEPLLGPIDLTALSGPIVANGEPLRFAGVTFDALTAIGKFGKPDKLIDWVICGGESGPRARPMHPAWARALRDQCRAAGVPFFFKQWGEWLPLRDGAGIPGYADKAIAVRELFVWSRGAVLASLKIGKKRAGRMLDGRTHDELPVAA